MESAGNSKRIVEVLVCEVENPPKREKWGTNYAEFRGRCYMLLGTCYNGMPDKDFPLLAECEKDDGAIPSIRIVKEPKTLK